MTDFLEQWYLGIKERTVDNSLMVESVEFFSPIVYKPIVGVEMVTKYLRAANQVLNNSHFRYTSELTTDNKACLVFETKLDDMELTGIDLIEWNNQEKMTRLSVFIRPFSALSKVGEHMSRELIKIS